MVTSAEDIISELGIKKHESRIEDTSKRTGLSKDEEKIYKLLQDQNLHFDELVKSTGLPSS